MMYSRLAAALLSVVLVLGSSSVVLGDSSIAPVSPLPEFSADARSDVQEFLLSGIESAIGLMMADSAFEGFNFRSVMELGSRLSAYRFDYGLLEAIEDIHWYPIMSGGEIVMIASMHGDPNSPTVIISNEFASPLRDFLAFNDSAFALLFMDDNLYAVTEDGQVLLRSYAALSDTYSVAAFANFNFRSANMQLAVVDAIIEVVPNDYIALSRSNISHFIDVPIVGQGRTNLCWAAVAASLIRHNGGPSHTPAYLASRLGVRPEDGAGMRQTVNAITEIWRVVPEYHAHFHAPRLNYVSRMITERNTPVPIGFMPPSGGLGHMVLFRSYSRNVGAGHHLMSFMDSALWNGDGGIGMTLNTSPTAPITITHGGRVLNAISHAHTSPNPTGW